MSLRDKLHPVDSFWDEKAQERLAIKQMDARINNLRGAIGLAEKILALKGNAGWQQFVKALEDCRAYRRQELELSEGTDAELRILQGRCRELGAVMSLLTQTETNTKTLVDRLQSLELERKVFVNEDGKVRPKGVHS